MCWTTSLETSRSGQKPCRELGFEARGERRIWQELPEVRPLNTVKLFVQFPSLVLHKQRHDDLGMSMWSSVYVLRSKESRVSVQSAIFIRRPISRT